MYRQRLVVPADAIDDLGHVSNVQYVRWVQDIARAHSDDVGYDISAYMDLGLVFVVRRHDGRAAPLLAALAANGILAGVDLGRFFEERDHEFLVAVTERHDRAALDRLVEALESV